MFKNPFAYLMVATFIGAVVTMLLGVAGLGRNTSGHGQASTRLMFLRVALCALLLVEILVYITWIRPA